MTTPPPPTDDQRITIFEMLAEDDEQGPLVRQSRPAATIARECHHAATQLWDLATYDKPEWMRQRARQIARGLLAGTKELPT